MLACVNASKAPASPSFNDSSSEDGRPWVRQPDQQGQADGLFGCEPRLFALVSGGKLESKEL